MNRKEIKLLDSVLVDRVTNGLPIYRDAKIQKRYQTYTSKQIMAWVRFSRKRPDGLFDCLHFARDYSDSDGFIYSMEGYINYFEILPFPPGPFGGYFDLRDLIPTTLIDREDEILGEFCGGGWYSLGTNLESASKRIDTLTRFFNDLIIPRLDDTAKELLGSEVLRRAIKLVDETEVGKKNFQEIKERIVSELVQDSKEAVRDYPIGKAVGQLLWKRMGDKNWFQV